MGSTQIQHLLDDARRLVSHESVPNQPSPPARPQASVHYRPLQLPRVHHGTTRTRLHQPPPTASAQYAWNRPVVTTAAVHQTSEPQRRDSLTNIDGFTLPSCPGISRAGEGYSGLQPVYKHEAGAVRRNPQRQPLLTQMRKQQQAANGWRRHMSLY